MSSRSEFVALAMVEGVNMSALCRRFRVSRKTGYKWLRRAQKAAVEGAAALSAALADRSRRPRRFRSPTPAEMEAAVLRVRAEHPAWGGRKIRRVLQREGLESVPAASTITAILHRHEAITQEASRKARPLVRFERAAANELWQMDFKGEFRTGDGRWCYPLTLLDDHSRFALGLFACGDQKHETVQEHLKAVFGRYGLPQAMLMDNGSPWGATNSGSGHTRLTAWLLRLDVKVLHGRPYHPQTQGKEERFHRTLKTELLQGRHFDDLSAAQPRFDAWRDVYNTERPHEALRLEVPASRYRVSPRTYPQELGPFEYGEGMQVRRVSGPGRFKFQGRVWKTSEAFRGEAIGLRRRKEPRVWSVFYCHQEIGWIDLGQQDPQVNTSRRGAGESQ